MATQRNEVPCVHRPFARLSARQGLRPKPAAIRLDQSIVLAQVPWHWCDQHESPEVAHVCGLSQRQRNNSGNPEIGNVSIRDGTDRIGPPVRPLRCESRHVHTGVPPLMAAVEHAMGCWLHAAKVKFAAQLVVLSEQCVQGREGIRCVVAVAQDVQDVSDEEDACGVLAQGFEASKYQITHKRQRGNHRQHFGRKSSDVGPRIVEDSLLQSQRVQVWHALGQRGCFHRCRDVCQCHALLHNDADTLLDMVGTDAARCAQVMHPIVADAFGHSRDLLGWTPDKAHARRLPIDVAQRLEFIIVSHPAGWISHHAAHFFHHAGEGCRVVLLEVVWAIMTKLDAPVSCYIIRAAAADDVHATHTRFEATFRLWHASLV